MTVLCSLGWTRTNNLRINSATHLPIELQENLQTQLESNQPSKIWSLARQPWDIRVCGRWVSLLYVRHYWSHTYNLKSCILARPPRIELGCRPRQGRIIANISWTDFHLAENARMVGRLFYTEKRPAKNCQWMLPTAAPDEVEKTDGDDQSANRCLDKRHGSSYSVLPSSTSRSWPQCRQERTLITFPSSPIFDPTSCRFFSLHVGQ